MRKTNYHTHTKRCMHASGSEEQYILSAIENGYEELGFSDHTPWDYESDFVATMRMRVDQFDDYYTTIDRLREKYKKQISIKIGLECEYYPKYMSWLTLFIKEKKLDYIIFGNHYLHSDEQRIYFGTACESDAMVKTYVDEAIEGMKTGLYSYLCHPDLFMRGHRLFDEVAREQSIRLCKAALEYDIPLEYNLAGAQYNDVMHTMQYPHIEFWKIAASIGNTAIIGVDAHEPRALESDIYRNQGLKLCKDLNMQVTDTIKFLNKPSK